MRTTLRNMTLAASAVLAGVGILGDRPAQAQNTYADAPFNQGSLFYRPSGRKPPTTTTSPAASASTPRHLFRRQRGYTYVQPPAYAAPRYPVYATRPSAPQYYYSPPR